MKIHLDCNASKPHLSKMYNIQETQKTVSFAFEFWYKPSTLYKEWYQKYISVTKLIFEKNSYERF